MEAIAYRNLDRPTYLGYRNMPDQERNIIIYRTADGRASVVLYAHDGKILVN